MVSLSTSCVPSDNAAVVESGGFSSVTAAPLGGAASMDPTGDSAALMSTPLWTMLNASPTAAGAIFDVSDAYRYLLWRRWDSGLPWMTFVMLNPSSADSERLDPTIRRCLGFAKQWTFGGALVVNLFGYRSASPRSLRTVADPIGPENRRFVEFACRHAGHVVAAWGNPPRSVGCGSRDQLPTGMCCLGLTAQREPKHPLYVPAAARLVRFVL